MSKLNLWAIGHALIRVGVILKDADAVCSGNPDRMKRRFINRVIGRVIHRSTSGFYLKGGRKR